MNGQGSNKILPIKSLLENLKQQSKKQYLQLDNKSGLGNMHQNNYHIAPHTHRDYPQPETPTNLAYKDQKKGISLNKNNEKQSQLPFSSKELPQPQEQGFNFYVPKRDKNTNDMLGRYGEKVQQAFRIDPQTDHYGYTNKNNKSEQGIFLPLKQQIKPNNKNCDKTLKFNEQYERESSNLTEKLNSKFEEETRYFSKFQKVESQPIFKDQLTKIKTQLFHKEAVLFTKTQQLQEKNKIINELQAKLEKDRKGEKAPSDIIQKMKNMEYTIKSQSAQNQFLRKQLQQCKQLYSKFEEDTSTNYALINLKLRQYQAEERQKSFQINQIKDRQKKKCEQFQKIMKMLKQLLKEKEDALKHTNEQFISMKNMVEATQILMKQKQRDFAKQIQVKESFIRQLSAEIGDLKANSKNMEDRIREMIEQQSEMRQIRSNFNEAKLLYQEREKLNEANKLELRSKISQLNQIVFKRESSLIAYKQKNKELEEKLKKITQTSRTNSPPPRSSTSTSKLIKDNQRLSAIAKDFDRRFYQSMKLNQALNEEVIKRELIILNASYNSRFASNIE